MSIESVRIDLQDFASSQLVRKPELVGQVPIITVADKAIQHSRYEHVVSTNGTV